MVVYDIIFENELFSVLYSVPLAPYVPEIATNLFPSNENLSLPSSITGLITPSLILLGTLDIEDKPLIENPTPNRPSFPWLLYTIDNCGVIPPVPGDTLMGISYDEVPDGETEAEPLVPPTT